MYRSFLLMMVFIGSFTRLAFAQEFKENNNGFIYDNYTMAALRHIVDSQNIRYRTCEPWKDYYSFEQGWCHVISLDSGNIRKAIQDIRSNISFDSLCVKYPGADFTKDVLVLKEIVVNRKGKQNVLFSPVEDDDYHSFDFSFQFPDPENYDKKLRGTWVYQYTPNSKRSNENLTAFFVSTEFDKTRIPEKYSRMIQYCDCMIDTSTAVLLPKAEKNYLNYENNKKNRLRTPEGDKLWKYIATKTGKPVWKGSDPDSATLAAYYSWAGRLDSLVDTLLSGTNQFRLLVKSAIDEAIVLGTSSQALERLAEKYDTKERTLLLKRSRNVYGRCSMDASPRIHAFQIANLAAETVNWEIFLRAHLDIMNDRFDRVSDGSYAWKERKTYISELEELQLNVVDLLLGTTFRLSNPSGKHYYCSVGRTGRALSECKDWQEFENKTTDAIQSGGLDDFNRILLVRIYLHYIFNLQDDKRKKASLERLDKVIAALPERFSKYTVYNRTLF